MTHEKYSCHLVYIPLQVRNPSITGIFGAFPSTLVLWEDLCRDALIVPYSGSFSHHKFQTETNHPMLGLLYIRAVSDERAPRSPFNNPTAFSFFSVLMCLGRTVRQHSLPEAVEEVSRSKEFTLDAAYLDWAEKYILSVDNSCKREASRIVGNLANQYPAKLENAITALLQNAGDDGTVIRWASAYALSRILVIPSYAKSSLFEKISALCEKETENGVKNQYIKALKKAEKLR